MARAPTTADAFTAIAEPSRRRLLGALARCRTELDVSGLVEELGWPQPRVSKHLGVLRRVGLVRAVRMGRRRLYSLNGRELRPVYDWIRSFERFWEHQLLRIKDRAEGLEAKDDMHRAPRRERTTNRPKRSRTEGRDP